MVKWIKKGRSVSGNGVLYHADVGPGIGKLDWDGPFQTEYFVKGRTYYTEEEAVQAALDASDSKETKSGYRFEVTYIDPNGRREVGPVNVRAKDVDGAAKKGLAELQDYDRDIKRGHLVVVDDGGAEHRFNISEVKK